MARELYTPLELLAQDSGSYGIPTGDWHPSLERRPEKLPVTPQSLWDDNHSQQAEENIAQWDEARERGELTATWLCSDARVIIPNPLSSSAIRTIACGGNPEPFKGILRHSKVNKVAIIGHFAGPIGPTQKAKRCGGREALEQLIASGVQANEVKGIENFCLTELEDPDLSIQTVRVARKTSEMTGKPTLAAAQDHVNGTLYPIAIFGPQSRYVISAIPLRSVFGEDPLPDDYYQDGIPCLDDGELPDIFGKYLEEYRKQVRRLYARYPDLIDTQDVLDPYIVAKKYSNKPFGIRFPKTAMRPNRAFLLTVPRRKLEEDVIISEVDKQKAWDQAQYPIEQSTRGFGSFASTNTLYIETHSMRESRDQASELVRTRGQWMKPWLDKGNQIIVAQAQGGRLNDIGVFKP